MAAGGGRQVRQVQAFCRGAGGLRCRQAEAQPLHRTKYEAGRQAGRGSVVGAERAV